MSRLRLFPPHNPIPPLMLRDAVRAVDRGESVFSPAMATRLSDALRVESDRFARAS